MSVYKNIVLLVKKAINEVLKKNDLGNIKVATGLRQRQKNDRSKRILEIARKRFQSQGYDAVTIDSIAAEADLSAVTVYNYYGSKPGLLLALVKESDVRLIDQLQKLIDDLPDDIRDAVAQFGRIMRRHALKYLTKPTWRQVLAASIIEGNANFGRTYVALDAVLIKLMSELVGIYQTRGTLITDIDPDTFGCTLFGMQNMRFFQFITDDALEDKHADIIFRCDLEAIFTAKIKTPDLRLATVGTQKTRSNA